MNTDARRDSDEQLAEGAQGTLAPANRAQCERSRLVKVHYRPVEAAVRWCGLIDHEADILKAVGPKPFPDPEAFAGWPILNLAVERILDAIRHREIPAGLNGVTLADTPPLDDPALSIRHVDLKDWMSRRYPEHQPVFLFGETGSGFQPQYPAISEDRVILSELNGARAHLQEKDEEIRALRTELRALLTLPSHVADRRPSLSGAQSDDAGRVLSTRAETVYLNIIAGQLILLLTKDPLSNARPRFRTQEEVITALIDRIGKRLGITKSTLEAKFSQANRMASRF